ncbi:hypothetical protein JHK82_057107 [Glycine max]|nr:hypothetical protein JHK87_057217 [Glycine soja]KAG5075768.1 hypothetical protein JHK84_056999 [Glycine max]KAG5078412.1 hypothetical protein JHK82_057107 [Glycine max]
MGATKVKLYDADVKLMVGLGNEYFSRMKDPKQAQAWIKSNLQAYPSSNLHYDNMLFAQIDAVYSALDSLAFQGASGRSRCETRERQEL